MKKGVAIPYIIAILLGIAVIGLIGFWLFKSSGIFGIGAVEQDCRNKFLTWCNNWFAAGYDQTWLSTSSKFFNGINKECKPFKLPGTDAESYEISGPDDADITTVKSKCFVS